MFKRSRLYIEGLSAYRVVDKLQRADIAVYSVRNVQKKGVSLEVAHKDLEKVFAILQGSCYNVKKVQPAGWSVARERLGAKAGLIAGMTCAVAAILFAQTRVLAIEVTGSGAYYESEVLALLSENGVGWFSPLPEDPAAVSAAVFSLPRVSFCGIRNRGGVLVVEIEVNDEDAALSPHPLRAPVSGEVRGLVVVRGVPLVSEGDFVDAGKILVDCRSEEGNPLIVIARAEIAVSFVREYGGTEEEARAAALLEYGEIESLRTERSESGWRVTGIAVTVADLNF